MTLSFVLVLACSFQDGALGDRLRKGGWAAVDELGARPEHQAGLEALDSGKDPELAWWAGAALADLDARTKAGDAWTPPLRVTLSGRDRNGGEVLRDILALGGRKGLDLPEGDRPVTVAFQETPFLEALDEVLRQSNLILVRGAGGRLQAVQGDLPAGPRFYHAGYAATVLSLVRRTDATFKGDPVSTMNLQLFLRGDPGFRILGTEAECLLVQAEDDTGRSLLREREEAAKPSVRFRGPAEGGAVAMLVLGVPAPGARKIAVIRGTSTLTLARKSVEIVFEDLAKKPSQDRESGPIKAQLRKLERTGEEVRLEVELTGPEGTRWPDTDGLLLEDADGRLFHRWGSSMNSTGTSSVFRMTYRDREGLGSFERLRVSVVTETCPRKVCFELKDLVLR